MSITEPDPYAPGTQSVNTPAGPRDPVPKPKKSNSPDIVAVQQNPNQGPGEPTYIPYGQSPKPPSLQDIQNSLNNLKYGQTTGTGASALAKQLAAEISDMSISDANKVLQQISGTQLGTDVQNILNPPTQATTPTNPGFDLGKVFSQVIAPFLAQQSQTSTAEQSVLAKQMQQALSGASPAIREQFAVSIPAMQQAQQTTNQAQMLAGATAPQYDALIGNLQNMINAYKAAQGAAIYEPYIAATQTGIAPTTATPGVAGQGQATLNSILGTLTNPAATGTVP